MSEASGVQQRKFVNAYVDGEKIVLLSRRGDRIDFTQVPAEYVTFLRQRDLTAEFERTIRSSSSIRSIKVDGAWMRIAWIGDLARRDMVQGRPDWDPITREKKVMPSPFMSLGVSLYEGDVDPIRRYMTDTGAGVQSPRRCYLDIEADSRVPFSEKEKARILMWSICVLDAENKPQHVASGVLEEDTDASERAMLEAMWRALEPYDQVLAWNLDNYDGPMITSRSDRVGVRIDPRRWLWLDHLALFKRMNMHAAESGDEKQSMALQNIAMSVLGEGKEETPPEVVAAFGNKPLGAMTWELWAAGGKWRELLHAYMLKDTALLAMIEAATGYATLFDTIADVCRVFPNTRGLNPTEQVDGFLLRLGLEQGTHFPTKLYRESVEQFPGAYVMQPKTNGVATDIHVGDFASLYPSIILTWNMSPETKVNAPINGPIADGCCRAPSTGITFSVEKEGILVAALREMLRLRKWWNDKKASLPPGTPEWKEADRRSTAYKVAANSFYGVISSPFSRYYDREIGESITQNGAWLIKQTIAAAEERGMRAIYCDTDSIFIEGSSRTAFEEFVRWCNEELYPSLLKACGCKENLIKLAYEKQFARIVFTSAKRYAGVYVHYKGKAARPLPRPGEEFDEKIHSRPEIKGLEYKRGDTALLARRLQERAIYTVLSGETRRSYYEELIDSALNHVLRDELTVEEVRFAQALTKSLREYVTRVKKDGTAGAELAHVAVAKILKERGREITKGTRIEYIVTDGSSAPNQVAPAEDYDGKNADRFFLWEDRVWPATARFLEAAFPTWDWKRWDRVRPPKPKLPPKSARPLPGQVALVLDPEEPFRLIISEEAGDMLAPIAEVLRRHPGKRPLEVVVMLRDGSTATMASRALFVSGSTEMLDELARMWMTNYAALEEWATSLVA